MGRKQDLALKMCRCVKGVRKTLKHPRRKDTESRAIAICVKSVLHSRGKTVKRFACGAKPALETQPLRKPNAKKM